MTLHQSGQNGSSAGKKTLRRQPVYGNDSFDLSYDQLVLATGYIPIQPNIEGCELAGVWTVSRLERGLQIRQQVERLQLRRAVIVDGGYVGLMMAHGLRTLGLLSRINMGSVRRSVTSTPA